MHKQYAIWTRRAEEKFVRYAKDVQKCEEFHGATTDPLAITTKQKSRTRPLMAMSKRDQTGSSNEQRNQGMQTLVARWKAGNNMH